MSDAKFLCNTCASQMSRETLVSLSSQIDLGSDRLTAWLNLPSILRIPIIKNILGK